MAEAIAITDPVWRAAVDEALEREGELIGLVRYANRGGAREWFVIHDQADLSNVLGRVGVTSATGSSDAISVLPTREFPHRGNNADALRDAAREIADRSWVILACKREGDPQLYDDEAFQADEGEGIEAWFRRPHEGDFFVGEDPYVVERATWPEGTEFVAYGVRPDGTVRPGAY